MDKSGEMTYIDSVVGIIVIMLLIVTVINIYSFLALRENLNIVSNNLLEIAATNGDTNEAENEFLRLCNEAGVNPDNAVVSFEGTEYSDTGDGLVKYGDLICVEIKCTSKLSAGGVLEIPVTVSVRGSCLSEKLNK